MVGGYSLRGVQTRPGDVADGAFVQVEHGSSNDAIGSQGAGRAWAGRQQTTMLSWATLSERAQKIKGLNFCASQFVTEDEVCSRLSRCTHSVLLSHFTYKTRLVLSYFSSMPRPFLSQLQQSAGPFIHVMKQEKIASERTPSSFSRNG